MIIPIIIASVVSMVFGFIWFYPAVFGKKWMALSGFTPESMTEAKNQGMAKVYIGNFIMEIVTAVVLFNFLKMLEVTTNIGAVEIALWLWLGFMLPIEVGQTLWMKRPVTLLFINSLHRLGSIIVIALVLTAFI